MINEVMNWCDVEGDVKSWDGGPPGVVVSDCFLPGRVKELSVMLTGINLCLVFKGRL